MHQVISLNDYLLSLTCADEINKAWAPPEKLVEENYMQQKSDGHWRRNIPEDL
jgi:hypothetical protein